MSEYPIPHFEEYWSHDLLEDYEHAHNYEERRYLLLRFGYDKAHKSDAERLFSCRFDLSGYPHKDTVEDYTEVEHTNTAPKTKHRQKFYKKSSFWSMLIAVLGLIWAIAWGVVTYFELL